MPSNYLHDRYLDAEERYEVRVVKAAERPHLLHWEEYDTNDSSSSDEKKTDEIMRLPLTDGCDIPGWRARRLAPCLSAEKKHIDDRIDLVLGGCLNIGSGASLFRRESQFPFITNDDSICWWNKTKEKLCTPPKPDLSAPVVEYDDMCALVGYVNNNDCDAEHRKVTMFSVEFEEKNRPVKILGATVNWAAMPNYDDDNDSDYKRNEGWTDISSSSELMGAKGKGGWTLANLVSRFGNVSWRFSDQHGEMMSLNTYAKYITSPEGQSDDSPLGVYDSQFGDDDPTKILLEEYTVPKCFSQDLFELQSCSDSVDRPPYRWILIGPERSGTGLHVDPLWTNAWVTVIQGLKRWLLFPPETPHQLIGMIEGKPQIPSSIWFADYYDKVTSPSWPNEYKPIEILQYHGETVFVPAG